MAAGEIEWRDGRVFGARAAHGELTLAPVDADLGGDRFGPKELVVLGLAGCTGMDVVSILEKMRAMPDRFSVAVSSEDAPSHPRYLARIHVTYRIDGAVTAEQAKRAVALSLERYCGVSATLAGKSEILPALVLNGETLEPLPDARPIETQEVR